MLAGLSSAYVLAINRGAVPNIESAWTYLCRDECQKGLQEAVEAAENALKEAEKVLPLDEEGIKEVLKGAREVAIRLY
jgi:hypothetical protein